MAEHSIILRKTEEARLDQLYQTKCDEDGMMNITQFFLLAIERNMISNKHGIEIFYTAFKEACGQDNEYLDNTKFYYVIVLLSKALFGHEENPFETMFSLMLVDQVMTNDMKLVGGRVPKMDEDTLEILSEESIMVYINYLDQLKYLFTTFIHTNFNAGKRVVNWREIEEKSVKMISRCFLKLARHKFLIPHMFNVESLQEFLKATIPPMTGEEYNFFENNEIIKAYESDKNYQTTLVDPFDGEPGLLFHEFVFLLGRIACNCVNTSETIAGKISDFFVEKLSFHRVDNQKGMLTYDDITKKLYMSDDEGIFSDEDEEGWDSEEELDEQQKLFFEFLQKKAEEEKDFIIDYEQILSELDPVLPAIPGRPMVEQVNPRPYKLPRIMFGKHMPKKEDEDAGKKKKKQPKKPPQRKKDEPPPKPVKWADEPKRPEPGTLDLVRAARQDLVTNVFPNNIRGDQCNSGVAPCIIKEVFFPPDAPHDIATLIESAIVYQNTANYEMAVHSFEQARNKWKETLNVAKLRNELELFFEMSLGSVYESCGKDDIALSCYIRAKKIQLVYNHPDQAFPYCGLGSVLYHMDEPAWALRCFLKAREIREERLGGDTVDTATVYNNLGCCMYMLERNQESMAYFELAQAILECELGPNHERTLTAGRNIMKANRTVLNIKPAFRQLWTTAVPHPCPKTKKKKKGKGGLDYVQDQAESAPLSRTFFSNKEKFQDYDIGVFDYVLKCIEGPYCSKFVYLNTASPEVIGGGSDYDISRNPDNITMFIENAELGTKHAQITFHRESNEYVLKDVSDHNSTKGIWIKIPLDDTGINLSQNNNIHRKFMIGKYKNQFEFQESGGDTEQVEQWLRANNLEFAVDMVKGLGVTKLDDLFLLTQEMFQQFKLTANEQALLKNRLKELSTKFQGNTNKQSQYSFQDSVMSNRKRIMKIIFSEGHDDVYQAFHNRPFSIGSKDKMNTDISLPEPESGLELKVYFRNGDFYLKGIPQENMEFQHAQSAYYQLFPDEQIVLHPGMIIAMGQVQFMVERFNVGVVADPGTRGNMEDTFVVTQDLQIDEQIKASLFSVIDGHGGTWCAVFLKTHLAEELKKQLQDKNFGLNNYIGGMNECVTKAFERTFQTLDEQFYKEMSEISYKCGAAAVVVLILGNRIYCASVGDSRAVLSRNGKAINLSVDQKATRQDEAERVIANGGSISCGRVEQRLAITRAFGDYEFKYFKNQNGDLVKKQFITSEPEVRQLDLDYFSDEFIVVGSDGLYDKFTSQEAVNYIRHKLGGMQYMEQDTYKVARDIANEAIYTRHVRDNVTVIIAAINRGVKLAE